MSLAGVLKWGAGERGVIFCHGVLPSWLQLPDCAVVLRSDPGTGFIGGVLGVNTCWFIVGVCSIGWGNGPSASTSFSLFHIWG